MKDWVKEFPVKYLGSAWNTFIFDVSSFQLPDSSPSRSQDSKVLDEINQYCWAFVNEKGIVITFIPLSFLKTFWRYNKELCSITNEFLRDVD